MHANNLFNTRASRLHDQTAQLDIASEASDDAAARGTYVGAGVGAGGALLSTHRRPTLLGGRAGAV